MLTAKLEPGRKDSGIVNDMFEAADDWKNFGRMMMEMPAEEGYDFSGRMEQEIELLESLKAFYGVKLEQHPDYAEIMELGAVIIAMAKQRKPHPDGVLGSIKIVRETFAFLQPEFGLVPCPDLMWNYASDQVCVSLDLVTQYDSSCRIKQLSNPDRVFELEDLLFMDGISASLTLPPGQKIATKDDVQAWFTTVANILRQHGSDVLADRPGAFERLAKAADERERLYIEECERLYGSGKADMPGG